MYSDSLKFKAPLFLDYLLESGENRTDCVPEGSPEYRISIMVENFHEEQILLAGIL